MWKTYYTRSFSDHFGLTSRADCLQETFPSETEYNTRKFMRDPGRRLEIVYECTMTLTQEEVVKKLRLHKHDILH